MKKIPLGLRDFLPTDIENRDQLIGALTSLAQSHDFRRIITPTIENYDQLLPALGELSDDCIMFFDRSGSRLVLRPDHTTPIARIVATRLADQLPIKLFYHDPVFRIDPLLGETEILQFGCEHIGRLKLSDEVHIISMVINMCQAIGLDDVEIHVAHPELFKNLSNKDRLSLLNGCFTDMSDLPSKGTASLSKPYPYMSQFFNEVTANGLSNVFLNFGLYKDLNYYNGLFFDVVSPSFGKVIGSGGRYDTVLHAFNCDANAFGFALRLHYLQAALDKKIP